MVNIKRRTNRRLRSMSCTGEANTDRHESYSLLAAIWWGCWWNCHYVHNIYGWR